VELKIVVPPLGESVVEGTIAKWLKAEGEKVKADEPLVEIMTDKINIEIPAPYDGTMVRHLVPVDTVVEIGTEIAIMETDKEVSETKAFQIEAEDGKKHIPREQDTSKPSEEFVGATAHHEKMGIHADKEAIEAGITAVKSSPIVRRLAKEHFIDLRLVNATGKNKRVTKEDVLDYINSRHSIDRKKPDFMWPDKDVEEIIPITGVRKVIAEHMTRSSSTIAHVTTFDECDMSELVAWRKKHVDKIEAEHGVRITYMPFFVKAVIHAAKDYPWINATFDGENLHVMKNFNIGFAVARENSLIVPVVRNCEQKSILQLAKEMRELGDKANADKLDMNEIQGGTFTITNAGMFGATASTPIIAHPQIAILGVHMIKERPVVRDGEIVIRPILNFGLSFDHRIVDGGYAVQFLRNLIEFLEEPESWLIGVV
jgi:2-oxoglutarate dehydrogenase complex dihydrolipoamide succinyltransferase (E2) component